jgi:hypothetical protein
MNTKICKVCKIEKEYSEFHKMKKCIGGVRTVCKECRKPESKKYRSRDYVIEKNKKYYQDNKEEFRKRMSLHSKSLNGRFHEYKKRAKRDNIEFEITEKDCIPFYNTDCAYCGNKINGLGIDRLDNKIGYKLDNMVPCCSKCNFMKYTMNKEEFIQHIIQIVKHLNIKI